MCRHMFLDYFEAKLLGVFFFITLKSGLFLYIVWIGRVLFWYQMVVFLFVM